MVTIGPVRYPLLIASGRSFMRLFALLVLAAIAVPAFAQDPSRAQPEDTDPRQMLYAYLQAEAKKHFDARRQVVANLKTPDDIRHRQEHLKAKFLEALGGFPDKSPLNAKVVGTLKGDGFRVEKVIYESRPNHHVTAN